MAYRTVVEVGDNVLRKTCRPVEKINRRTLQLLDDLFDTMIEENGAGLAAPQVGVLRRMAVVMADGENRIDLINPEMLETEGEQEGLEGCLSIPGKYGVVVRPQKVRVRSLDREGNEVIIEAEGFTARAVCHEMDHLDGVLYIDKQLREATEEDLRAYEEESSGEEA